MKNTMYVMYLHNSNHAHHLATVSPSLFGYMTYPSKLGQGEQSISDGDTSGCCLNMWGGAEQNFSLPVMPTTGRMIEAQADTSVEPFSVCSMSV